MGGSSPGHRVSGNLRPHAAVSAFVAPRFRGGCPWRFLRPPKFWVSNSHFQLIETVKVASYHQTAQIKNLWKSTKTIGPVTPKPPKSIPVRFCNDASQIRKNGSSIFFMAPPKRSFRHNFVFMYSIHWNILKQHPLDQFIETYWNYRSPSTEV